MSRLRWKKNPPETGLRAVGAGPRGSKLHDGVKEYAHLYPDGGNWRKPLAGWYWVCAADAVGEYMNTCNDPAPDEKTAKAQAMAWVQEKLASLPAPPCGDDSKGTK